MRRGVSAAQRAGLWMEWSGAEGRMTCAMRDYAAEARAAADEAAATSTNKAMKTHVVRQCKSTTA